MVGTASTRVEASRDGTWEVINHVGHGYSRFKTLEDWSGHNTIGIPS